MLRSNGPAKRRGRLGAPAGRAFPPGNDHQHPHPCIAAQARLRHAAQCGRCTTAGRCSARPGGQSLIKDSLFSTGRPVVPPLDEVEFISHMQAGTTTWATARRRRPDHPENSASQGVCMACRDNNHAPQARMLARTRATLGSAQASQRHSGAKLMVIPLYLWRP